MSLKEKVKSFKKEGIAFMQGRDKGELTELFDRVVTVRNYDFIDGDDGTYLVFIVDEEENKFYFGGVVLTSNFAEFDEEDKNEILENGLKIKLQNVKGKKHNYTSVEYIIDDVKNDLPF